MIKRFNFSCVALSAVASLALAGCGNNQQAQQQQQAEYAQQQQPMPQRPYTSIQECMNDRANPQPQLCQQSFTQSQDNLPHYGSYSTCEQSGYSDCTDHGGWFGPALAGFVLGSMMNGSYHQPYPVYMGGGGYLYSPYGSLGYHPTRSYYGGSYHYSVPTTVVVHSYVPSAQYRYAAPATAVSAMTPTVRRGGFGATQAKASFQTARPATFSSAPRPTFSAPAAPRATGGFGGGFGGGFRSSGGGSSFHSSSSSSSSSRRH
jgi:uncharacterized protein YgiB involved in biofilm formation